MDNFFVFFLLRTFDNQIQTNQPFFDAPRFDSITVQSVVCKTLTTSCVAGRSRDDHVTIFHLPFYETAWTLLFQHIAQEGSLNFSRRTWVQGDEVCSRY
jgi:hypothetical protein